MDGMREKLFPIFLQEAKHNLQGLKQFFADKDLSGASLEDLETAFRAAHTLKGTSRLVRAESVCKISRRLEAMLENHYSAQTVPTPVEHEAMQLAVDWLTALVAALQGDLEEPSMFVSEALQAMDLATAFPGRTPLVELLDSQAGQPPAGLDDPFDGDPALIPEEETLQAGQDPFADDPGFGMELDFVELASEKLEATNTLSESLDDPFVDDDYFLADGLHQESDLSVGKDSMDGEKPPVADLPFDPFADDDEFSAVVIENAMLPVEIDAHEQQDNLTAADLDADPFAEDTYEREVAAGPEAEMLIARGVTECLPDVDFAGNGSGEDQSADPESAVLDDPFAEDEGYIEDPALIDDPFAEDEGYIEDPAVNDDPFADDEGYIEDPAVTTFSDARVESPAEGTDAPDQPFGDSTDRHADGAGEITDSLLLPQQEAEPQQEYACCVFTLDGRNYYLPIGQMLEIAELPQVLPLPLAPPMVSGLINLRGQIMPVINLAVLNQHQTAEAKVRVQRRLVVGEYQGESLAFLAEGVPYLSEIFIGEKIDMAKFLSLYRVQGDKG